VTEPAPATYKRWMIRGLFVLACCLVLVACGSEGDATRTKPAQTGPPQVAASCIFAVEYEGHRYIGTAIEPTSWAGEVIGQGTIPACNDTPGAGEDGADQVVDVAVIPDVSPEVALAIPGRNDTVLIREDVNREKLPPPLAKLMPPG
jgi:hypothetical protein